MKIVFFGTPEYVVPVVQKLRKAFTDKKGEGGVIAVVTQEPKLSGRKHFLEHSAVDAWAHKKGVEIIYKLEADNLPKADLGVLAAYGKIIPKSVIRHFPHGILNIHPSLLPNFRGASPVQATIATGEEAGVTIIKIDEKMDHGPIVSQIRETTSEADTSETLREKLFLRAADALPTLIPAYVEGKINVREQDHKSATFTKLIKKSDGYIPGKLLNSAMGGKTLRSKWEIPFIKDFTVHPTPSTIHQFIRAMHPWPGCWTEVKILRDKDTILWLFVSL